MEKQLVTVLFDKAFIDTALVHIAIALQSCNNCITTDDVKAEPDETHWRINNSKELMLIRAIEDQLGIKRGEVVGVTNCPTP